MNQVYEASEARLPDSRELTLGNSDLLVFSGKAATEVKICRMEPESIK